LTAVVLNWRMKSGNRPIASASSDSRRPIAPIIPFRFPTSASRSGLRSARAPVSEAESTISDSSAGWSEFSSPKTLREVERNGFR
jgi:hypothetical protein